ncbi:protein of unknown function [Caloramator quimbayensis]|uniref:DUF1858 domain-containing protein n=1 Tax=Caloramator quimbayensis TaxID=1147123 RepID=A0A1T4WF78_9CLOT|nr:DUF1858 domain-containing protein [Caloramator quimbayensis]SKA75565.1 protein of unknown function [Caloramator quimbayensis]
MITQDMIVLDIVEKYPKTEKIFKEYDVLIGKCLLCNHLFDSIENISKLYKINIDEMIYKLNSSIN